MEHIILQAKEVCKSFANNGGQNHVLNMVDLKIYDGDFTVIMGSSGAGKSTLLYALSGMDKITSGQVFYKDREISNLKEKEMAQLRAFEFGFVFQQTHLVSNLTLLENVVVTGYQDKKKSTKEIQERAQMLLEKMNVDGAKDRLPFQLSGGEAQRAAIARALINEPGIIFADEPTGALNKRNTIEVLDLLTEVNRQGQNIVMVTHDLWAAVRATRLIYLEDGRVIDEMRLPAFDVKQSKERETQINAWLTSLKW